MSRRRHTFAVRFMLLLATLALAAAAFPLLDTSTTAQTEVPGIPYTPIMPDGPDLDIPAINTVAPNPTPAGVPTEVPGIPYTPIMPDGPDLDIPAINTAAPALTPIFPVETAEPTATMAPEPTATVAPTPTVVTGFGNLTIHSRTCDNQGFNPYFNAELTYLLAECPASDREFEFTLTNSIAGYTRTVITTGGTLKETVPAPDVGIQRANVPGYDLSSLSCSNDPFNKDAAKSIAHYAGTTISPGESVTCYWFNVLASTDVGIAFSTLACPAVPPLTTPSVTPTDSDLICTWPPLGGVTITLADTNPSTPDQVALSNPDPALYGMVQFIDLPPGTYTFTLTPPPGATHAYLPRCSTGFSGPSSFTPPVVTGSGYSFTLTADAPGEAYTCSWYVVTK